jgi:hypothetical protein
VNTSTEGKVRPLRRNEWWFLASILLMFGVGRYRPHRPRVDQIPPDTPRMVLETRRASHAAPRRSGWWVLAGVLLLLGTACVVIGAQGQQRSLAGPVTEHVASSPSAQSPSAQSPSAQSPSAARTRTEPLEVVPLAAARSDPIQLQIPAIGLTESLSTLGLNADGSVQVPTDIQQPGWYRLGPSPGQIGSAVILGHVDSYQGPAAFFKLRLLVPGDLIDVTLADGVTAQFKITSVTEYLKEAFPDQAVYGPHGYSALQLVTCAGVFDPQTGHYLSNIVVFSTLVALTPAASPGDLTALAPPQGT